MPARPKRGQNAQGRAWRRLVSQTVIRDHGRCWLCGHWSAKSADHIIPDTEGGPTVSDNLNAAHARGSPCPDCSIAAGKQVCCNERRQYGSWERARRKLEEATGLTLPMPADEQLERARRAVDRWGKGTGLRLPEGRSDLPLSQEGRDF